MVSIFDGGVGQGIATAIINSFCRTYTWRQREGVYQTTGLNQGTVTRNDTDYTVTGSVAVPASNNPRPGTTIVECDADFWISGEGLAFTPEGGDHVVMDGQTMNVVRVDPLPATGEVYAYNIFIIGEAKES